MTTEANILEKLRSDIGDLKLQCKELEVKMILLDPSTLLKFKSKVTELEIKMVLIDPPSLLKFQSAVVETLSTIEETLRDYVTLKETVLKMKVKMGIYVTLIAMGGSLILSNLYNILKFFGG